MAGNIDPEIRNELYSRIETFFGSCEFTNVNNSYVVVVGLGGVGSHAAHMLVRSGITHIRIIDFDQVLHKPPEITID